MQPDNHADAAGPQDDWRERFCLAWEAGVEMLGGLVILVAGLLVVAILLAVFAALPIPLTVIIGFATVLGAMRPLARRE